MFAPVRPDALRGVYPEAAGLAPGVPQTFARMRSHDR